MRIRLSREAGRTFKKVLPGNMRADLDVRDEAGNSNELTSTFLLGL